MKFQLEKKTLYLPREKMCKQPTKSVSIQQFQGAFKMINA